MSQPLQTAANPLTTTGKAGTLQYTPAERTQLTAHYDQLSPTLTKQQLVRGIITSMDERTVLVDIGYKTDGVVSRNEFKDLPELAIGQEVEIHVHPDGRASYKQGKLVKVWKTIQESLKNETPIQAHITTRVKGGLYVDIHGIHAFLPGSQLDTQAVEDYDNYLGKTIDVIPIKISATNNNVVVSHRRLLELELTRQRSLLIESLEVGQILEGTVKNMLPYAAFIDLGGLTGFAHITDLSWQKVNHPSDILEEGQTVKVVVTGMDADKGRINLSIKNLTPDPWEALLSASGIAAPAEGGTEVVDRGELIVGAKVKGTIAEVLDYGALLNIHQIFAKGEENNPIDIPEGVRGLLHISEMSWSPHARDPKALVKVGDKKEALITECSNDTKKLSLSFRIGQDPWQTDNFDTQYGVGTTHKATVQRLTTSGAIIALTSDIVGHVHNNNLSWDPNIKHAKDLLKEAQSIDVMVLEVDANAHTISLGIKQLQENPWDAFEKTFQTGTVHKGTIAKQTKKRATVTLPDHAEGYANSKDLLKKDNTQAKTGEQLDFMVIHFDKPNKRILLSHTATHSKEAAKKALEAAQKLAATPEATLGDLDALSQLKAQIEASSTTPKATTTKKKPKAKPAASKK